MQNQKKSLGMGMRANIIIEYGQTGGDADGDNGSGNGDKIFYRVILYCAMTSYDNLLQCV